MFKIIAIARYTFTEIFRNRVYYVLLLFGGMLIVSTLLLGSLGGQERNRMITDLGLAGMELFALVIAVFASVTLVLQEMESRTLYLVLTRPVSRYQFILGRFFGLVAIITLAFALMAGAHLALMEAVHIPIELGYATSLYFSWERIVLITAVALVFSLFSTSTISAVTFTLFFWVMGHFSDEILYLARKSTQPLMIGFCRLFYYVAPNFQLMNVHSLGPAHATWLWDVAGYGFSYTALCLCLTIFLFRKKEF